MGREALSYCKTVKQNTRIKWLKGKEGLKLKGS